MYGSDSTQAAALASTGAIVGWTWNIIAMGVLIMAGITLITIARVIAHRARTDTTNDRHHHTAHDE